MTRMIVPALAAAMVATFAVPALSQSYRSALPLTPGERRAIELRLSTILDGSAPNQVSRFDLPGGGQAAVRAYRVVTRPGQQPCRGYRIDVDSEAGRSAVDGYRCRRRDGQAWVIVEPEILVGQTRGPLDLSDPNAATSRAPDQRDAAPSRDDASDGRDPGALAERLRERGFDPSAPDAPFDAERYSRQERQFGRREAPRPGDETLYSDDDGSLFDPGEVPPLPRRPPVSVADAFDGSTTDEAAEPSASVDDEADVVSTELDDDEPSSDALERQADDVAADPALDGTDIAPDEAVTDAEGVVREPEQVAAATERDEPATDAVSDTPEEPPLADATPPDEEPAADARSDESDASGSPSPDDAGASPGPSTVGVVDEARVVGGPAPAIADRVTEDRRVVAALRELDYLDPDADASETAVDRAIGDFARDERFALPISSEGLVARLNEALERSGSLALCTEDEATALCLSR